MAGRQILLLNSQLHSNPLNCLFGIANFSSKSIPYMVKVGIPEFLNGVGKGVEKHVEKLESELGDLNKLLVTRTIKLKRLGIPCQDCAYSMDHSYLRHLTPRGFLEAQGNATVPLKGN
ncbi:uncharacterized protein [Henckelia pumila]|uniref:uncharacterized protein n=1 Tax=Henckelia pumila TaxID=405737 RepID=UPI003C6E91EF